MQNCRSLQCLAWATSASTQPRRYAKLPKLTARTCSLNWLAHVFLSEPDVEFRLGNLLADIVRGEELRRMSAGFQRGVQKHKQIDAFTDSHPLVKRSRSRSERRVPSFQRRARGCFL